MHRWYIKTPYQEDHDDRAVALQCDLVLENTSVQVNPQDTLPHVIIQVGRLKDGEYMYENLIYVEPVSLQELDAIPGDDPYPDDPDEE